MTRFTPQLFFELVLLAMPGLWVSSSSVEAGVVTIETQMQVAVVQEQLQATITVANRGTDSAYAVQVTVDTPAGSWASPAQEVLGVQAQHTVTLQQMVRGLSPGQHPFMVRVHYADANRYPFSALAVSTFTVGQESAPAIWGVLERAVLRTSGRLTLRLKNLTDEPLLLTVRLVLPQELSTQTPRLTPTLSAAAASQMAFSLSNFSALGGSTYPVYAVIEYDREGAHATTVATALVQIEAGTWWQQASHLWAALAGLLFCALVVLNVRPAWRHRQVRARAGG